jgi:hypothetical protein
MKRLREEDDAEISEITKIHELAPDPKQPRIDTFFHKIGSSQEQSKKNVLKRSRDGEDKNVGPIPKKPRKNHRSEKSQLSQDDKIYVSFDIGIIHLAYVIIAIPDDDLLTDPLPIKILETECVDVTQLPHNRVDRKDCQLHHTKEIYDRMTHFWQEYESRWVEQYGPLYKVFLERQPITGITSVESLLFQRYRDKVIQVSPNAMHKYFGINNLDYDQRKEFTVTYATPYLEKFPSFTSLERKHDCADAFLLFIYQMKMMQQDLYTQQEAAKRKSAIDGWLAETQGKSLDQFFQQFKFNDQ